MKKVFKFSIMAALLVSGSETCLNASDSLVEALTSGKASGAFKFQYVKTNANKIKRSDARGMAIGGELNYVTGSFNGLKAGITFQTSSDMGLESSDSSKVDSRVSFTNTNLSQAYLDYSFNENNSIKVGRQYIYTPLVFTSDLGHLGKGFFNAALFKTKSIPKTKIIFGALDTWFQRDAGLSETDEVKFDKPIYTLYLKNQTLPRTTFTTQALYSNGSGSARVPLMIDDQSFLYSTYMLNYKLPTSLPIFVEGRYYDLNYEKESIEDTSMYTYGVGTKLGAFKFRYDYTKTDEGNDIIGTIGHTPSLSPGLMTFSDAGSAGMESNSIQVNISPAKLLGIKGFKRARIKYSNYEQVVRGTKLTENDELMFDFIYKFSGAFENLTTRTRFATADYKYYRGVRVDSRISEFRTLFIYKF